MNVELVAEHGGGGAAVRDETLLGSALGRAQNLYAYGSPAPSLLDLAAATAFGIARNHAFIDGNKRTALVAVCVFLADNGLQLLATNAEAAVMIEGVADGSVSEQDYAAWLAGCCQAYDP